MSPEEIREVPERIATRIEVSPTGCWLWKGSLTDGYGSIKWNGRTQPAHRAVYEMLVGPFPAGLVSDHLCRVRHCVNPAHIDPVTNHENILRGNTGLNHRAKTHCPQGHPYDAENTYTPPDGHRTCRICRREAVRRWRAKR